MGHATSEFEIKNSEGETVPLSGFSSATIGTTIPIPAVADKIIESIYIQNDAPIEDAFSSLLLNIDSELLVSIDNGVSFKKIYAGQGFTFDVRNIKQVLLKSNVASCPFSSIIKLEKFDEVK